MSNNSVETLTLNDMLLHFLDIKICLKDLNIVCKHYSFLPASSAIIVAINVTTPLKILQGLLHTHF